MSIFNKLVDWSTHTLKTVNYEVSSTVTVTSITDTSLSALTTSINTHLSNSNKKLVDITYAIGGITSLVYTALVLEKD